MKLGIKTGLKSDWKNDLLAAHPDFCEIWFNGGKIPDYEELFAFIKTQNILCGLHFWGAMDVGTLANLAYPDSEILKKSRQLIKDTLDAASRHQALYVNLHPIGKLLAEVDFDHEEFIQKTQSAPFKTVYENFQESLIILSEYAVSRGIPLYVESTPKMALGHPWKGTQGRQKPTDLGEFLISELEPLLTIPNLYFANDFGHTAGNIVSDDRTQIKNFIFETTTRLAPKTKLLHITYIIPPYNGTDYHGYLYDDEFNTNAAVPNRDEMKQLLSLFIRRDDVHALVEPETDHVGNFKTLQQLVSEIV